jgi:hypothetical protein
MERRMTSSRMRVAIAYNDDAHLKGHLNPT